MPAVFILLSFTGGGCRMTASLKRHLKDFGPRPARMPLDLQADAVGTAATAAAEASEDPEVARAAAYEEGRRAATEILVAEHQRALAALAEEHEEAVAKLKREYEGETAERIERRFGELVASIGERIGREVAGVLAPFVEHAVAGKMAAALAEAIVEALGESEVTRLTVSGPAGLFALLRKSQALSGVEMRHIETDAADIAVEIDRTVFSTRLGAFAKQLAEALP